MHLFFHTAAALCLGWLLSAQAGSHTDLASVLVPETPGLARVLIIGDSISIGYAGAVSELLRNKANVYRIIGNGSSTTNGLAKLSSWLDDGKWDVIHFNFGLHDAQYRMGGKRQQVTPAEYEANLRAMVRQLQATGARLIWATTTPAPEGELGQDRKFADVTIYNNIALKIMRENHIAVNDLYAAVLPAVIDYRKPKDVHFNSAGYQFLAERVAASIAAQLPQRDLQNTATSASQGRQKPGKSKS